MPTLPPHRSVGAQTSALIVAASVHAARSGKTSICTAVSERSGTRGGVSSLGTLSVESLNCGRVSTEAGEMRFFDEFLAKRFPESRPTYS
jgi:hypothetical protein